MKRDRYHLELDSSEVKMIIASIRETLDALADWEIQTRTGFEREDLEELRRRINTILM